MKDLSSFWGYLVMGFELEFSGYSHGQKWTFSGGFEGVKLLSFEGDRGVFIYNVSESVNWKAKIKSV